MRIHVFNTTEAIVRTCNMWACSTRSIEYLCAWLRRIKKCTNSCVCVCFALFDSIHIGAYLANYSFNFLITSHLYVALCGCVVINEGEYANYASNERLWTRPHFLNQSLYLRDIEICRVIFLHKKCWINVISASVSDSKFCDKSYLILH